MIYKSRKLKKISRRMAADKPLKKLSQLSKRPKLDLINSLFNQNFSLNTTDIDPIDKEFVSYWNGNFASLYADTRFRVRHHNDVKDFHIEFQMHDDPKMIVRMFDYGYQIAKERQKSFNDYTRLRFPEQVVIYLEANDSLPKTLSYTVEFPPYTDDKVIGFTVPIEKLWDWEDEFDTRYALLPFKIFSARHDLENLFNDTRLDENVKSNRILEKLNEVKNEAEFIAEELRRLLNENKITTEDMDTMGVVLVNLTDQLYNIYERYSNGFVREVRDMVKTLIDHEALRKAAEENTRAGERLALTRTLLRRLNKIGNPSHELVDSIKQENDIHRLDQWVDISEDCKHLEEFEQRIRRNL